MDIKEIIQSLKEIEAIAREWEKESGISAIERDLALDKLKKVYEKIKFASAEEAGAGCGSCEQPSVVAPAVSGSAVTHVSEPESAPSPQEPEPICFSTSIPAPVEEPLPAPSPENTPAPESSLEKTPTTVSPDDDSIELGLFTPSKPEEAFKQRPLTDKQVIKSLYDEDLFQKLPASKETAPLKEPAASKDRPQPVAGLKSPGSRSEEPESEPQDRSQLKPEPGYIDQQPLFCQQTKAEQAKAETIKEKKILGEVLGNRRIAINDALGKQNQRGDVAGMIYSRSVVSLRQSIGVNDRFLLMRDLFGGDSDLYGRTIAHLDTFEDFDDAMIYISENFSWESENETVSIIVDLLERKLGL